MFRESDGSVYSVLRVLKTPTTHYEGQGHVIFMDKYYGTIGVYESLHQMNIFDFGTWIKDRLRLESDIFLSDNKKGI